MVDTIKRLILTKMCTSKEGGPFFFSIVCSQVRLSAATSAGCGFASLRSPPLWRAHGTRLFKGGSIVCSQVKVKTLCFIYFLEWDKMNEMWHELAKWCKNETRKAGTEGSCWAWYREQCKTAFAPGWLVCIQCVFVNWSYEHDPGPVLNMKKKNRVSAFTVIKMKKKFRVSGFSKGLGLRHFDGVTSSIF